MNDQKIEVRNSTDENGNPAGGHVSGEGLHIVWQDGPLGRGPERIGPNGTFVETVLRACLHRLGFYQTTNGRKFECAENGKAMTYIGMALDALAVRTARREAAATEGTHEGN